MHVRNKDIESAKKGNLPLSQKEYEKRTFNQEIEGTTLFALENNKTQLLISQSTSDLALSVHGSGFEKKHGRRVICFEILYINMRQEKTRQ